MNCIFSNIIIGNRYFIYEKKPFLENEIIFRANIVAIYKDCITVNCHENEKSDKTIVTIPHKWITKILSLTNIINNKSYLDNVILDNVILDIIDNYL